jgi:hypothetical protein
LKKFVAIAPKMELEVIATPSVLKVDCSNPPITLPIPTKTYNRKIQKTGDHGVDANRSTKACVPPYTPPPSTLAILSDKTNKKLQRLKKMDIPKVARSPS